MGEPKYPVDFTHFDYVNPDAPKGGGPPDDLIKLHIVVVPPGSGTDAGLAEGGVGTGGSGGGSFGDDAGTSSGNAGASEATHVVSGNSGGCGCHLAGEKPGRSDGAPPLLLAGLGVIGLRRRRR